MLPYKEVSFGLLSFEVLVEISYLHQYRTPYKTYPVVLVNIHTLDNLAQILLDDHIHDKTYRVEKFYLPHSIHTT